MTDKERLEEVAKNVVFLQCGLTGVPMGVELPEDDYWYLYEQAERVQELESDSYNAHLERLLDRKEQEIERYREALEFYADRENYEPEHYDPDAHDYTSIIDHDKGATARKALEVEGNE